MSSREKTKADFDLEQFIDMFDEALTSKDERVVNALRSLMMMVILTRSETPVYRDKANGPLRQLQEDMYNILRRMESMSNEISSLHYKVNSISSTYGRSVSTDKIMLDSDLLNSQMKNIAVNQIAQIDPSFLTTGQALNSTKKKGK